MEHLVEKNVTRIAGSTANVNVTKQSTANVNPLVSEPISEQGKDKHYGNDALFDDKIMDVVKIFAHDPDSVMKQINYLDSIHFGVRYNKEDVVKAVRAFSYPHAKSFQWNENYQNGLRDVWENLPHTKFHSLRYSTEQDLVDVLSNPGAHAGFHQSVLKLGRNKTEVIEAVGFDRFLEDEKRAMNDGNYNLPIIPLVRNQASGAYDEDGNPTYTYKGKTRLVSAIDVEQILTESRFSVPIQFQMNTLDWYTGGKDVEEIAGLVKKKREAHQYWISLDYSKYDQTLPSWLLEDAFSLLRDNLVVDSGYVNQAWNLVVNSFINKSFLLDGNLIHANHGVPSGSMFTNVIDSVANRIMITTYLKSRGITEYDFMICGDDNIIFTNDEIDVQDLSSYLHNNFGVKVNYDKTNVGDSYEYPRFLSREWRYDGQYRHPNELISKLAYPERYRKYESERDLFMILFGYRHEYNLGMKELLDWDKVNEYVGKQPYHGERMQWEAQRYVGIGRVLHHTNIYYNVQKLLRKA